MPLNVLIVPDKFKGTLSAAQVSRAIARGWRKSRPSDRLTLLPMSDGGDGFGAIISRLINAKAQRLQTVNAAHRPCKSCWWWDSRSRTAVIESANVIGLAMLPPGLFHPFDLDTFGLGRMVQAAFRKGAHTCLIGIGGSATNDGGFGLARSLGWEFLDRHGEAIHGWTGLSKLHQLRPPAETVHFRDVIVAADVQNPLLGPLGASRIYGPQKGLRPAEFKTAERNLKRLAEVVRHTLGRNFAAVPGSGAAGGLGFGLFSFLNAHAVAGVELFARHADLERRLLKTDLVITGEGRIDASTLMGKGVGDIARRCRKFRVCCIGIAGQVNQQDWPRTNIFTHLYGLAPDIVRLDEARARPARWLEVLANRVAELQPQACGCP